MKRSLSLSTYLCVVVVALLLAVALTLVLFAYVQGRATAQAQARAALRAAGERIVDRFDNFMDAPTLFTVIASVWTPQDEQAVSKLAFAKEAIDQSPQIDGIYLGTGKGMFLQVVPLNSLHEPWRQALKAPAEAAYAFVWVREEPEHGRIRSWRFLNAAGQSIGGGGPEPTKYDPRIRPWYSAALPEQGAVLSGPYQMAVTGKFGLTISRRHVDDATTVVAVDVLLDSLSQFLGNEHVSEHGRSYLFDRSGQLVAHSDPSVMRRLLGVWSGQVAQISLLSADPVLARVKNLLRRGGSGDPVIEDSQGSPWLMQTASLRADGVLAGYKIALASPLADFTAPSERTAQRSLVLSAVIVVLGVLLALLVAWRLGRPLAALTATANRLEDLDFEPKAVPRTRVAEIAALALALAAARGAIRTFALYVPKEIVRAIVSAGGNSALAARREEVTVLFTDIRDFTTICEANRPEAVVEMLSGYFETLSAGVYRHGGAIIQFLGDSIYASWNAPTPDPDHADHACACALDLVERIRRFNEAQSAAGRPVFITRLGLHTGQAIVGSVGSVERLQYTGMGDTVNVASRLEGLNKQLGTTVLVSEAVRASCLQRFAFRALGKVALKGRSEELQVYELLPTAMASLAEPRLDGFGPAAIKNQA